MADAVTSWAAATATDDQSLAQAAEDQVVRRRAADAALAKDLGVPSASATPASS
jgi:hypothetical protein